MTSTINSNVKNLEPEQKPSEEEQKLLLALYGKQLYEKTVIHAKSLVSRYPNYALGWNILGLALQNLGRNADALLVNKKTLQLLPNESAVYCNLGINYKSMGKFDEAELCYLKGLEIDPNSAVIYYNLGINYREKEDLDKAEICYKKTLEINPNFAEAYVNLANIYDARGNLEQAEQHYYRVLEIKPDLLPEPHSCLGANLFKRNRLGEALQAYENGLKYFSTNREILSMWVYTRRKFCDWQNLEPYQAKLVEYFDKPQSGVCAVFGLLMIENFTPEQLRKAGEIFANSKCKTALQLPPMVTKITHHHRKLRIGYLSADFHSHATVYLMAGILEHRNTQQFDVYLYSYGIEKQHDEQRQRIQNACEVFRHVRDLSDEQIAKQIVNDEIDILVDLKGYTQDTRVGIQAMRPAPIIVSWLGYPGSLGHQRLADYIIGDPVVTPLENAAHFSETLALMPHCYQPNDNKRVIDKCPTREEAGLPEDVFVFCTFNQAQKFTPEMFNLWCRLLDATPNSVLWILEPHEIAKNNLRDVLQQKGIDVNRLIFAPKMEQTQHLARLQLADLALDTFPYTSHTTASDALWAGVPLITKMGETFASAVAASILKTMNLEEFVTTNDEDYFNVASNLALNPEKFAKTKQKIVLLKRISPLFNTQKFAYDLEQLYQIMWLQGLRGERKPIDLRAFSDA